MTTTELFSIEAEQWVLGAMLIRPELIDSLACDLVAEDFYYAEHYRIFKTILDLHSKQLQIDVLNVSDALNILTLASGEQVSALSYVGEIARSIPSVANAQTYAKIVRERSVCRGIEKLGFEAREIARTKQDLADKISEIQRRALALDSETSAVEVVHAGDVLTDHIEEIQRRYDLKGQIDGLATGNADLDQHLKGLKGGELYIVAARPAMGKTAFAMNIASHNAIEADKSVLVVSLEMTNNILMDRLLAAVGSIPLNELKSGLVAENYPSELTVAANKINQSKLYLTDRPNLNVMQLRSLARRHKMKHGLDLLVVDYLQLMQGTKNDNRVNEVSEMSRQCKLLARELNIPVILLSQLNRALEQRPNKRPIMSDLRESGAIEQDADVIIFLYRDEVYTKEHSRFKGVAEVILGKFRNGELASIYTAFNGAMSRFDLLAKGWQPEPEQADFKKNNRFLKKFC